MSGRYASYWNAFLYFIISVDPFVCVLQFGNYTSFRIQNFLKKMTSQ